jgi:hypothetical protein
MERWLAPASAQAGRSRLRGMGDDPRGAQKSSGIDFACSHRNAERRFCRDFYAGGGTRTPDTRIMIPLL